MAELATAAATVGIADVAIKSIKGLYNTIQEYRVAPEGAQRFREEITGLQNILSGLNFVHHADDDTEEQAHDLSLDQYLRRCSQACVQFEGRLAERIRNDKWKGIGDNSMTIMRSKNYEQNQQLVGQVRNTARLVSIAVGLLTLYVRQVSVLMESKFISYTGRK